MTRPMTWPKVEVTVFYDCRGERKHQTFDNEYEARSFYKAKFKDGKNPSIQARTK